MILQYQNVKKLQQQLLTNIVKLLKNIYLLDIPDFLDPYLDESQKYLSKMNNLFDKANKNKTYLDISLQNNLHPANTITLSTKILIKNYFLQYTWQEYIHDYIYSSDNTRNSFIKRKIKLSNKDTFEDNIFFYANIANYFSSDAYYTSSSVNAIVIEDQRNINLELDHIDKDIKNSMYLIAAIENFADMINHLLESECNIKLTIIKFSKYLYRIYRCFGKINKEYFKKLNKINKNVIPYRKSYNIQKATKNNIFKFLFYNNDDDIKDYIKNLSKIIFNDIDKLNIIF